TPLQGSNSLVSLPVNLESDAEPSVQEINSPSKTPTPKKFSGYLVCNYTYMPFGNNIYATSQFHEWLKMGSLRLARMRGVRVKVVDVLQDDNLSVEWAGRKVEVTCM
ncbi:hypothetical protein ACJX0J_037676, partial [Zea mays]